MAYLFHTFSFCTVNNYLILPDYPTKKKKRDDIPLVALSDIKPEGVLEF
jgi:hypothetical protein